MFAHPPGLLRLPTRQSVQLERLKSIWTVVFLHPYPWFADGMYLLGRMKISTSLVETFARGTQICYSTSRWGWRNFIYSRRWCCWMPVVELCCPAQGQQVSAEQFEAGTVPRLTSDIGGPCCPEMLFCPWTSASSSFHPLGPHLSLSVSCLHALASHRYFQLPAQVYELSTRVSLLQHEAFHTSVPAAQAAKSLAGWD